MDRQHALEPHSRPGEENRLSGKAIKKTGVVARRKKAVQKSKAAGTKKVGGSLHGTAPATDNGGKKGDSGRVA